MPPHDEESLTAAQDYEYLSEEEEEEDEGYSPSPPGAPGGPRGPGQSGRGRRGQNGRSGHVRGSSFNSTYRRNAAVLDATATGGGGARGSRSIYRLTGSEQLRGVANRILFSRYYIGFYFVMMCLSLTTVVLSLMATHRRECPPVAWHILEVIVNVMMVLEVSTRWVAYGKKYPMTPLNIIDLLLVLFCTITLLLVFRSPCSEGTRQEEVLDTILLVIRNAVQFLRLGNILRRSGHSLLNPPKPIDLSNARTASLALDLDLDLSDDEAVAERQLAGGSRRTLAGRGRAPTGDYEPIFQDGEEALPEPVRKPLDVGGERGREGLSAEDEDAWDRLG